jgi:hypothetical protein
MLVRGRSCVQGTKAAEFDVEGQLYSPQNKKFKSRSAEVTDIFSTAFTQFTDGVDEGLNASFSLAGAFVGNVSDFITEGHLGV